LYKKFRFHPFDRDECNGEGMDFDVFISFAHDDSKAAREILNLLEQHAYKVCFHQRDFVPGNSIHENINNAVHRSKRTLCLLSNNFIDSSYCMDEFVIALHYNTHIKRRRLIVVALEPVEFLDEGTEQQDITSDDVSDLIESSPVDASPCNDRLSVLRNFVSRHTYIDLSLDSWRDQLLYSMPVNKMKQNESSHSDSS
jgi:protein toll